jgi:hypothetical protein
MTVQVNTFAPRMNFGPCFTRLRRSASIGSIQLPRARVLPLRRPGTRVSRTAGRVSCLLALHDPQQEAVAMDRGNELYSAASGVLTLARNEAETAYDAGC